ncbi:MAG: YlxM family DNA-binding protein [Oscillospiraceae bacterium]|nr:YlxM family DNA-binding protein [Oscillospiraceae bacterium]
MDALQMALLFDYYGELLTERQRMCFDLRHNQDFSLAEIAEELQVSRQGVHDNLSRAEALLLTMEEKTGCVRRAMECRKAAGKILQAAGQLKEHQDKQVSDLARIILDAARNLEE